MKRSRNPDAVLERLLDDARSEEGNGALDWDTVESSLLRRVKQEPVPVSDRPPMQPVFWLWAVPTAAAAVAAGLLFLAHSEPRSAAPAAAETSAAGRVLDGARLTLPATVEALSDAVTVKHRGRALWTLSPRSLARLERAGDVIEIALDRGVLDARVEKNPMPESFVVVADRTRVAVHGTAFRVTRSEHDVTVDVTEGVVSVGPVGEPSVKLGPASHAVFSLSGAPLSGAPGPGPVAPGAVAAAPGAKAPEPATSAEKPRAVHASGSEAPSTSQAEGRAVSAVRSCFASQTRPEGDLKITASTTLSLRVLPDGRIVQALLEPPLAPGVQSCVDGALEKIRFPATDRGLSIDRTLNLER